MSGRAYQMVQTQVEGESLYMCDTVTAYGRECRLFLVKLIK